MNGAHYKRFLVGIIFGFFIVFISNTVFGFFKKEAIPKTQAFSFGLPFGGPITRIQYDCCNGIIVTVNNYNLFPTSSGPKDLLFTPGGSRLFANYQINTPGVCVKGDAVPVGLCVLADAECEGTSRLDGTIMIVGTTLVPTMCSI
jgi:hypothetical protein